MLTLKIIDTPMNSEIFIQVAFLLSIKGGESSVRIFKLLSGFLLIK